MLKFLFKYTGLPAIVLLALSFPPHALADSAGRRSERAIRELIKQHTKISRKLARALSRADADTLKRLTERYRTLSDSDSDGFPDVLESAENTDLCNSDSDDDGLSDGDEARDGSEPGDADSDDDGVDDGDERDIGTDPSDGHDIEEHKGLISSLSGDTLVLSSGTYALTDGTNFKDQNGETVGSDTFSPGDCVEVEGYYTDAHVFTAHEVKQQELSECSGGDD